MLAATNTISATPLFSFVHRLNPPARPESGHASHFRDVVQLGRDPVGHAQSLQIVVERSIQRLRQVVTDARAELGLPENAELDISAEATANRIADFALGAFQAYRERHADLGDDDARSEFAAFIGAAIDQGITEARDILSALQALTPEVDSKITSISSLVQQRLDAFLHGE